MAEMTPMMKQYLEMKDRNPDSILFFRLGDFYEMFFDDAKLASRELDLTLTSRDHGKHAKPEEERVPMCGIPYHASEAYIARLIAKGYKVAICEQMEDPATAKGLVKRDIIRVVTPGTVIDAACLEEKASNFLCGIYIDSQNAGAAFCDISTGKTHLTAFSGPDRVEHVVNELGRFSPAEAVVNDGAASEKALTDALTEKFRCRVENGGEGRFRLAEAERNIRRQFGEEAFDRLPRTNPAAAMALGGLLHYLYETQKTDLGHIAAYSYYTTGQFMELDLTARQTLELTGTMRAKEKKGSLLWVLDRTKTAMGGRLLRGWIERPLLSPVQIGRRQQAVSDLYEDIITREELVMVLKEVTDLERLIGKIDVDKAVNGALAEGEKPKAPGMKYRHYAPKAPVTVITGAPEKSAQEILRRVGPTSGVICFEEFADLFREQEVHTLGPVGDKLVQAQRVFDALRTFDTSDVTEIFAQCPDNRGLGLAIGNRLKKAAGFHVVEADSERVVLGLTGGTGAGKSSALRAIRSLGGEVIDCDALYHEMLETCAPLRDEIGVSFPGAFDAAGQLDRRKLGQEVFSHKDRLEQLNGIVARHLVPEVRRRLAASESKIFAIDAINLLEGGLDQLCDRTIAVTAPLELRVRRIMARDNITEQYARLRISAQQPDEYYRGKCDCELNNAADTAAAFEMEAREFFQRLIDTIKEEKAHGKQGI